MLAPATDEEDKNLLPVNKLFVPNMPNKRFFWVCHNMSGIHLIEMSVNQKGTL